MNVRVSRKQEVVAQVASPAPIAAAPAANPVAAAPAPAEDAAPAEDPANHPGAVTSPMVRHGVHAGRAGRAFIR